MAHHHLLFGIEALTPGEDFELEAAKRSFFPGSTFNVFISICQILFFLVVSRTSATGKLFILLLLTSPNLAPNGG